MSHHRKYLVTGMVQGVGFRYHAQKQAAKLSLVGWVRNLSDGRVELQATGREDQLDKMYAWLLHGPAAARVSSVAVEHEYADADAVELPRGFSIR